MEYRNYRDTGLKTSLLGFGCMRFPMLEDGKTIDRALTEKMVDLAYKSGVNYFDTAYVYNGGESERTIGAILKKYPRESYFLTSKMPNFLCKNEADVARIFNESLERCGVDYFDFYLCHNVNGGNIDFYTGDNYVIPYLEKMKAEGKIRYLGFSSHGKPEELQRMVNVRDWDFAQIQFNYLDWTYQDAEAQYAILEKAGLPIMVMEPVRGGRLADLTPEEIHRTTGLFATNDELIHCHDVFEAHYPNRAFWYPGTHLPNFGELRQHIVPHIVQLAQ